MSSFIPIIKLSCITFLGLTIGFGMYAFYYFTSLNYELCIPITSCTYEVYKRPDNTTYYYYYIVNKEYTCEKYCPNITNLNTCPINGSNCHLTAAILDYCRKSGFEALVACNDFMNVLMPILSIFLCLIAFIMLLILVATFYPTAEAIAEEQHESYEELV